MLIFNILEFIKTYFTDKSLKLKLHSIYKNRNLLYLFLWCMVQCACMHAKKFSKLTPSSHVLCSLKTTILKCIVLFVLKWLLIRKIKHMNALLMTVFILKILVQLIWELCYRKEFELPHFEVEHYIRGWVITRTITTAIASYLKYGNVKSCH